MSALAWFAIAALIVLVLLVVAPVAVLYFTMRDEW